MIIDESAEGATGGTTSNNAPTKGGDTNNNNCPTMTAKESSVSPTSVFFSCDDLTPDLCVDDLRVEEGQVNVQGISVTYWVYHSSSSSNKSNAHSNKSNKENDDDDSRLLPIVVIHGGPSFTHNYMLPLKQQACRGRTVVFYDQGKQEELDSTH